MLSTRLKSYAQHIWWYVSLLRADKCLCDVWRKLAASEYICKKRLCLHLTLKKQKGHFYLINELFQLLLNVPLTPFLSNIDTILGGFKQPIGAYFECPQSRKKYMSISLYEMHQNYILVRQSHNWWHLIIQTGKLQIGNILMMSSSGRVNLYVL